MPELPEVETLVRSFKPLEGTLIHSICIKFKTLREPLAINELASIKNVTIESCYRRAKYMIWQLNNRKIIVFHLGMSGTLGRRYNHQLKKHDHVIFTINKEIYAYNDPRRFGMIWLFNTIEDFYRYRKIGIEPLSNEFNEKFLFDLVKKRKSTIKSFLFNQSLIAGLGNIYINEALFSSRILPHKSSYKLSQKECGRLVLSIKQCLTQAIENGGSTLSDFHDSNGNKGWFQNCHLVYNKKQCPLCGSAIKKEFLAQRSTFYCPSCQS